jgi:hypothetical protein
MRCLWLVLLVTPASLPYIVTRSLSGAVATRADYASVQMFLNQHFIPGFTNSDGAVAITPDSDVMGALNAAMATWNNVPTTPPRILLLCRRRRPQTARISS